MNKYNILSVVIPVISIFVLIGAYFFLEPQTTGLVILSPEGQKLVNADVTLSTKEGEIIPPNAIVRVSLDDASTEITIKEFIERSIEINGGEFEIRYGDLSDLGYSGEGYTGNYNYKLSLSDFNLNRNIGSGEHVFITRIIFRTKILYEKENRIMISESSN